MAAEEEYTHIVGSSCCFVNGRFTRLAPSDFTREETSKLEAFQNEEVTSNSASRREIETNSIRLAQDSEKNSDTDCSLCRNTMQSKKEHTPPRHHWFGLSISSSDDVKPCELPTCWLFLTPKERSLPCQASCETVKTVQIGE